MKIIEEFKSFVMRGNVVDMAVGVIIGAAFGKIVSSFVSDIIMPPLGILVGGIDFSSLSIVLKAQEGTTPEVAIRYGSFINTGIDFLIVAMAIFAMIKMVNRLSRKSEDAPSTKDCPQCLMPVPVKAKKCGHCTSGL